MSIYLGSCNILVSQHFLDISQSRPVTKQITRERMSHHMRSNLKRQMGKSSILANNSLNSPRRQSQFLPGLWVINLWFSSTMSDKQGLVMIISLS